MQVTTYGNRHRLTITADAKDGNTYYLDSATAADGLPAWTEFGLQFQDGTHQPISADWKIAAAMMAKAVIDGHCHPRHIQRVPAFDAMPQGLKQALFNKIHAPA
jgi:hypothetical protein